MASRILEIFPAVLALIAVAFAMWSISIAGAASDVGEHCARQCFEDLTITTRSDYVACSAQCLDEVTP